MELTHCEPQTLLSPPSDTNPAFVKEDGKTGWFQNPKRKQVCKTTSGCLYPWTKSQTFYVDITEQFKMLNEFILRLFKTIRYMQSVSWSWCCPKDLRMGLSSMSSITSRGMCSEPVQSVSWCVRSARSPDRFMCLHSLWPWPPSVWISEFALLVRD